MDEADGLCVGRAARPRNARDRDGHVGARMADRTLGHGDGDLGAHGPVRRDEVRIDAEGRNLGRVGVGDEAAVEHGRGAGDVRDRRGDKPAGTTLRGGKREARRLEARHELGSRIENVGGQHRSRSCSTGKEKAGALYGAGFTT